MRSIGCTDVEWGERGGTEEHLTVQEAVKYFHIGDTKLRKLIDENPGADYILWNGTRPRIKRRVFEQFVDEKLTAI